MKKLIQPFALTTLALSILALSFSLECHAQLAQEQVLEGKITQAAKKPRWSNQHVEFEFNSVKGTYSIIDKRDGKAVIEDASFSINKYPSTIGGYDFIWKTEPVSDELGTGQKVTIEGKVKEQPSLILEVFLYDNRGGVVLNVGTDNASKDDVRILNFSPLKGKAFKGVNMVDFKTLDGQSAAEHTQVSSASSLTSKNNLLATFGAKGARKRALVMGGLTYLEFQKAASVKKQGDALDIELMAEDPVGKLVDGKSKYLFKDKFYVDFTTDSRFEALETYGDTLRVANRIDVSGVTIPILNFWYTHIAKFGADEDKNNTLGTLEKLEEVRKTGFLKYSPVGLRMEPDDYALPNNQQGWWDDAHWQMYKSGQLLPPYDTMTKWSAKVRDGGGVPFIYSQTAKRSEDYALTYPEHMLFNSATKLRSAGRVGWWGRDGDPTAAYWTYDFTDPGFIAHMQEVYKNLKDARIQGVKFDYTDTGWAYDGGFEDKHATTTFAYRNIFQLAHDGLGKGADVYERLPPYGDVALGVVSTQRTEGDNDRAYPARIAKTGLRWYKNRMVVNYDHDPINPHHVYPSNSRDGWRAALTMTYTTSARMEIGKYFEKMSQDQLWDLSRMTPLLSAPTLSARPVDAFSGKLYPQVYDFKIQPNWHIVTFFNQAIEDEEWPTDVMAYWAENKQFIPKKMISSEINVAMGDALDDGGLGLDPNKNYYVFDFWNWTFSGKIAGNARLKQTLRPGEARVLAVHEVQTVPQFVSTNRHLLQGHLDMVQLPAWNAAKNALEGVAKVVQGDPYKIIVAGNGLHPGSCRAESEKCQVTLIDKAHALYEITIHSAKTMAIPLSIQFNKTK